MFSQPDNHEGGILTSMKARPVGPGRFSIGPEHNTSEMLRIHPIRPVPITATKIATGAAKAARRTSSLH